MNTALNCSSDEQPLSATRSDDAPPASGVRPKRDRRALRILAKSMVRELRQSGAEDAEVVALATEIMELLTSEIKRRREGDEAILDPSERGGAR